MLASRVGPADSEEVRFERYQASEDELGFGGGKREKRRRLNPAYFEEEWERAVR